MKCECGCGQPLVLAKRGPASRRRYTALCALRVETEKTMAGQAEKKRLEAKADAERALAEFKVALGW